MRPQKDPEVVEACSQVQPGEESQASFSSSSVVEPSLDSAALGTEAKRRHLKGVALAEEAGVDAFEPVATLRKVCMKPPCGGEDLVSVFPWVISILVEASSKIELPLQCMTQPTGDLFPLPTEMGVLRETLQVPDEVAVVIRGMCVALNCLYGVELENPFSPVALQVGVLRFLEGQTRTVLEWEEKFEETSWQEFLQVKTIDYCGEEVLCAQYTTWDNLSPAMPAEIASVPLADVVELGCRHYVMNFASYVLPEEMQKPMKPPRLMISDEAWPRVCEGLLGNGVCIALKEAELYHVGGRPLLNGLFGVPKGEEQGGHPIHRLIMDLRPANLVCRGIDGDVSTLPTWATMSPLQLMPAEDLVVSSEDVRCFFYIFQVPREWSMFLGFNKPIPRELWPDDDGPYFLASQVLPMGFKNSVSLAQHVHRAMVRRAGGLVEEGLKPEQEIRKDRRLSLHHQPCTEFIWTTLTPWRRWTRRQQSS